MKKIFFYFMVLVAAAACGMVEEENDLSLTDDSRMITEVISGSHGSTTKATIADTDGAFAWTEGDNIAVHVSKGETHKYVFTSGQGGASVADETADFSVSYEEGYSRDAFAVYPSTIVSADAANYGQSGAPLDVTLPGSYTLAQVTGETTPCPMIATNTAGTNWTFYQLCGLLRLTVNGIPSSSKRLEIDFDGKQVWGDFSVSIQSPLSTSVIATAADNAHDVITITKGGSDVVLGVTSLVANIPLPVGTYTNFTVTAYDALTGGNATLVLTRPFTYTASNQNATKRTASSPSSMTAFRGYEVSAGILKRDGSTDPATYSLTSGAMILTADPVTGAEYYSLPAGCNPFEPAVYYNQSASLNTYFHKWLTLRGDLGKDGNNINATSDKLPDDWRFPTGGDNTSSDWGKIILGAPKSTITVNGTTVASKAYAMVQVNLESGNSYGVTAGAYYGMFLLRDGSTIPAGYFSKIGSANYTENPLSEAQFNDLIKLGCLFISASGYYSELSGYGWRELSASWQYGYYWSPNYYSDTQFYAVEFYNTTNDPSVKRRSSTSDKSYYVVKLVKPVIN